MDNKIENGKYFYDIEKIVFFNNLKNINKNSNNVLEQFKLNFDNFSHTINHKQMSHSNEILEFLLKNYNNYLEEILLLSSNYAIHEIIKTLSHILCSDYHIIEDKILNKQPHVDIQLHLLMKQVTLTFYINIIQFNKKTSLVIHKKVKVMLVFNITNFKYLRIILETLS